MKIKITKVFDMYNDIFHCDTHGVDFSLPCAGEHIKCEPTPTVTIIIPWYVLFHKCMNVKTGPNITDVVEGRYTEKWIKNEMDRVNLCDRIHKEINQDDSV